RPLRSGERGRHRVGRPDPGGGVAGRRSDSLRARSPEPDAGGGYRCAAHLRNSSVTRATNSSVVSGASAADRRIFRRNATGTSLALLGGTVAGLITAKRRECWGSQGSEAKGHRNHAMPFCFVLVRFPATTSSRRCPS